ncbi:unnamed protein product, partial [Rotaria socialis]
ESRHVAIPMYKMLLIEKLQILWITYRKSGMGELQQPRSTKDVGLKIWPFEIRSRIKHVENANITDNEKCQLFVDHCQKKLNDQNEIYRNQLRYRTSHIIQLFKRLCKFKYEEAVTKYHFNSLKQCIPEHFTLNSMRNQLIGKSSVIDSIQDGTIRKKLSKHYIEVAEQAKTDIMILARDAAERQMRQYQTKCNMEMNQVWQHEKTLPTDQR